MKKLLFIILVLFLVGCSSNLPPEPDTPSTSGNYYKYIGDWATDTDNFYLEGSGKIDCSGGETITLSIVSTNDDYIYKYFYIWNQELSQWGVHEFDTESHEDSYWIKNEARYDETVECDDLGKFADENNELYVVGYACSEDSNDDWDCHGDKWQLDVGRVSYEENSKVGFIGCSITHNAVDGYELIGGTNFWDWDQRGDSNFGGGSIYVWWKQLNNPEYGMKEYWGLFEEQVQSNPDTEAIWWELCSGTGIDKMTYSHFLDVLNKIKEIAPGKEVYVSDMPYFPDTPASEKCKQNLPRVSENVARLMAEGEALPGPNMAEIPEELSTPDGCHANIPGRKIWGKELMDFFG